MDWTASSRDRGQGLKVSEDPKLSQNPKKQNDVSFFFSDLFSLILSDAVCYRQQTAISG
jgi:hypothetical protein